MKLDLPADSIDLIECPLDGWRSRDRARRPDSEEDGDHSTLAQTGNIHGAIRMAKTEVKAIEDEALRGIDVGVDYNRPEMEIPRFGGNG
jgi:hypothetical protein